MVNLNVYLKTIDEVTRPILSKLRDLRHPNIKYWCNTANEGSELGMRDLQPIRHHNTDNNICCYNWDIYNFSILQECDGFEHLIWRSINESTKFVCIDSTAHCNNQIVLFQDAQHLSEYPKLFVKIPCFNTFDALIEYASSCGVFPFSLENGSFDKCTGIQPIQGAIVYIEKNTGYYWYKDMLHKTHYEVFDSTGKKHIGEANLDGVIDYNKKDSKKRINVQ